MVDIKPAPPDHPIIWSDRATWFAEIDAWLNAFLNDDGREQLKTWRRKKLYRDDSDWVTRVLAQAVSVPINELIEALADYLERRTVRTFHGCRVDDAGVFHRDGLLINDPDILEKEARRIVDEEDELAWMRESFDERLAAWNKDHATGRERDTGKLYVVADDRMLTGLCGHYALYGSEWITAFLGLSAHRVLRRRGIPTILEIDLPLDQVRHNFRSEFAQKLLREWTYLTVKGPDEIPALNFAFTLRTPLSPEQVVGHYHPHEVMDPLHSKIICRTEVTICPSCKN